MAMTPGGITRTVALWVMMIGACVADGLLWWRWAVEGYQFITLFWATFWACIISLVVGYELWATITKHMTISTMYKKWITYEKENGIFPWGRTVLIILAVALNALIIHLWFW